MSDYTQTQNRRDAEHSEAYRKWYAMLSPEEKKTLAKGDAHLTGSARLNLPYVQNPKKARRDNDPDRQESEERASENRASYSPDISASVDTLADQLAERFGVSGDTAKRIVAWHNEAVEREAITYKAFLFQRVIAGFIEPGNLRVRAGALAFAAGLDALNGLGSLREFSKKVGVSPAIVSRVKLWWQKELNLSPSPHGKSEQARANYSTAQKEKHWRNKKCQSQKKTIPSS